MHVLFLQRKCQLAFYSGEEWKLNLGNAFSVFLRFLTWHFKKRKKWRFWSLKKRKKRILELCNLLIVKCSLQVRDARLYVPWFSTETLALYKSFTYLLTCGRTTIAGNVAITSVCLYSNSVYPKSAKPHLSGLTERVHNKRESLCTTVTLRCGSHMSLSLTHNALSGAAKSYHNKRVTTASTFRHSQNRWRTVFDDKTRTIVHDITNSYM